MNLPYKADIEDYVLASGLQSAEHFRRLCVSLDTQHFTEKRQALFKLYKGYYERHNSAPEMVQLIQYANDYKQPFLIEDIETLSFLPVEIERDLLPDITELKDVHAHRSIIIALKEAQHLALTSKDIDIATLALEIENKVLEATRNSGSQGYGIDSPELMSAATIQTSKAAEMGGFAGYRTKVDPVDRAIGGAELGHVTCIYGPAGLGKTALAIQMGLGIAEETPVGIASYEMNKGDFGQRIQANRSKVNFGNIRSGELSETEFQKVADASGTVSQLPFWLAPPHIKTLDETLAWYRTMHFQYGVNVFFLDNVLSLDYHGKTEYDHVTQVANKSQNFAREFNVHLCLLHHSNSDGDVFGAKAIRRHCSNVLKMEQGEYGDLVNYEETKGRNVGASNFQMKFAGEIQRWNFDKGGF